MFSHNDLDLATAADLHRLASAHGVKGHSKLKGPELDPILRAMLPPREAPPVPLFVELCAGTAALSLRLARPGLRPPATRMGSKGSYATAILHALGLYPGQWAVHHLWCEPDVQARVGLELLRDRALALEAAKVIRGWQDPPGGYRALWDSLRAKGDFTCQPDSEEAARYLTLRAWTLQGGLIKGGGYKGPDCAAKPGRGVPDVLAERLEALPELDAVVLGGAVAPPLTLPPGTICYIDPPYANTTGYAHDLSRREVIKFARAWAEAGATVCISEQEAIPELVAEGWEEVEITGAFTGATRRFSKQKREFLTIFRSTNA